MLQDIFTQGTLEMSATPLPALESAAKWSDLLSNRIIAVAVIFIILIDLPDLIGTFPHILDCMTNKRGSTRVEHSPSIARSRNSSAIIMALAWCLLADRFGFYRPQFLSWLPDWAGPVAMAVLVITFLVLRRILLMVIRPRSLATEEGKAAHRVLYTFFIVTVLIQLATAGVMILLHVGDSVIRTVLLVEMIPMWLLALVRIAQILGGRFSGLESFLYLCGLEIVPAAAVVASAVLL